MQTRIKLIHKSATMKTYEVCEVVHPGTLEEFHRLIGVILEYGYGYEWEHSATKRHSGSCFPKRSQALRALKAVHQRLKHYIK